MKPLTIILLVFSLIGCSTNSTNQLQQTIAYKSWTISLKQVNANLTMVLPSEYDTILAWKETSCGCLYNKYRIQNKKFPIYFDGCCIDTNVSSEKFQVTVQEPQYSADSLATPSNSTIIKNHNQQVIYSYEDPQAQQTQFDTVLNYNGKVFSIFSNISHDIKHSFYRQTLQTTIYAKGLPLKITFEKSYLKLPLDRSIFINESISLIKSMTTTNGT